MGEVLMKPFFTWWDWIAFTLAAGTICCLISMCVVRMMKPRKPPQVEVISWHTNYVTITNTVITYKPMKGNK